MIFSKKRHFLFIAACTLFLGAEVVLLNLSHWQYSRLQQAQTFEASLQQKIKAPAKVYQTAQSGEFDMVKLQGQFDNTRSRWLANQKHLGHNGWRLLTPFVMGATEMIVDRGWYKNQQQLPALEAFTSNANTVEGLLRTFPERSGWLQGPVNNTDERELLFLDPSAIPVKDGVTRAEIYMQAKTQTHQKVIPAISGMYDGPPHLQYMLTWLSLAILLPILFIWRVFSAWRNAGQTSH